MTYWNACHTRLAHERDAILLSFDTAWSPPEPIFDELARRFPKLKIEGSLIEEMYSFGGNILCQNGDVEWEDRSAEIRAEFDAMMSKIENETGNAQLGNDKDGFAGERNSGAKPLFFSSKTDATERASFYPAFRRRALRFVTFCYGSERTTQHDTHSSYADNSGIKTW